MYTTADRLIGIPTYEASQEELEHELKSYEVCDMVV
jgi:hypothetical protein